MKSDKHIKESVKETYGLEIQDKDVFWAGFKRRASRHEQAARGALLPYPGGLQWAAAMALVVVLLGGAFLVGRPGEANASPVVTSLEILGSYDSVFVLEDAENQSTIVWVVSDDA